MLFISKEFTEFCESAGITQSMSKAGYPYDNAPMERYFNTLKNGWNTYNQATALEVYRLIKGKYVELLLVWDKGRSRDWNLTCQFDKSICDVFYMQGCGC